MDNDGDDWAISTGTIWLNPAFVQRQKKTRIGKKSGLRLSTVEMVWIVIMTVIGGAISYFMFIPVSWILPFLYPIIMAFVFGPIIGWFAGRKIAAASPYRKLTGEGLSSFLMVQADSNSYLLKRILGRTVAVNTYRTVATGRVRYLTAVEWLGTARAPIMPRFNAEDAKTHTDINFALNARPTDVMGKVRERDAAHRRFLLK